VSTKADPNYEQAYQRLETIVEKLEGGSLTLEESLRLYEEAAMLRRQCEELLSRAEAAIQQVTADAEGTLKEKPFEHDDNES